MSDERNPSQAPVSTSPLSDQPVAPPSQATSDGFDRVVTHLHSWLSRKPDVWGNLFLNIVFGVASVSLFFGFIYPICWLYLVVPLGLCLFTYFISVTQKKLVQKKAQEHEAWMQSPQGRAWQEGDREKLRKQKEEDERRRKEDERQRKDNEEAAARTKWRLYHESTTMAEVSRMTGTQFEEFLARLFSRMGYTDITLTPTNDQGGDLLCLSPSGVRVVIQAKRWQDSVGNRAVQELLGAMLYYIRDEGIVVTNSTFTEAARELAQKDSRITLRDGRWLAEQIKRFLPVKIPEFSWEKYNRVMKDSVRSWAGKKRTSESGPSCNDKSSNPREGERERQAVEAEKARVAAEAARQAAEQRERAEEERKRLEAERRRQDEERQKRETEATQRRHQELADRERAERMGQWKRSGMPQEWVLENLDGWDHPTWLSFVSRVKSTPFWPLKADEMLTYLEGLRDELRAERVRKKREEHDAERKRKEEERLKREAELRRLDEARRKRDAEQAVERKRQEGERKQEAAKDVRTRERQLDDARSRAVAEKKSPEPVQKGPNYESGLETFTTPSGITHNGPFEVKPEAALPDVNPASRHPFSVQPVNPAYKSTPLPSLSAISRHPFDLSYPGIYKAHLKYLKVLLRQRELSGLPHGTPALKLPLPNAVQPEEEADKKDEKARVAAGRVKQPSNNQRLVVRVQTQFRQKVERYSRWLRLVGLLPPEHRGFVARTKDDERIPNWIGRYNREQEERATRYEPPFPPTWSIPARPDDAPPSWDNVVRAYEEDR